MQDAQQRWGCLTTFDLSTIKNGVQLVPIARDRYSLTDTEAKDNVAEWVRGKEFS